MARSSALRWRRAAPFVGSASCSALTGARAQVDGEAAGGVGVHAREDVHRFTAELGYWLGRHFWGRGIMTRVVGVVARWAMGALALTRLEATPYAHNAASRAVLEKSGFVLESTARKAAVKEGRVIDMCVYVIISEDDAATLARLATAQ